MGYFRAAKRIGIWFGLIAERATETDAINEAVVERGIRDARASADRAHYANGRLAGQIAVLQEQAKRQDRQRTELQARLHTAAVAQDSINGSHYAEQLALVEEEIAATKATLDNFKGLYRQNTEIIANSLREIRSFTRDFEAVKAKAAVGRSLEQLAGLMKVSISELQGMMGDDVNRSLQHMRETAAGGEGQMRATLDLAKELGADFKRQQDERRARGAALFEAYQKQMGLDSNAAQLQTRLPKP
jgi:hypothetical protein